MLEKYLRRDYTTAGKRNKKILHDQISPPLVNYDIERWFHRPFPFFFFLSFYISPRRREGKFHAYKKWILAAKEGLRVRR